MVDAIGGRKFAFAVLIVILGFVLVIMGKVTPEAWITLSSVVGGIYVTGNVVSKFAPPGPSEVTKKTEVTVSQPVDS
jgi:hypothetical protein